MKKQRAFLKWAGGKYTLVDSLAKALPQGDVLFEPFVGAGTVFLNSDYRHYVLADINPDLINLYQTLAHNPQQYIDDSRRYFVSANNDKTAYYALRDEFNQTRDSYLRSLLFLYLNRHGFNGLCRYNRSGGFNVPFGKYKKPYFPQLELEVFAQKSARATFLCQCYRQTMAQAAATADAVVYCDPPYAPLSTTANFTSYAANGFSLDDQAVLARLARETSAQAVPVLISNHDTELTRELYRDAQLSVVQVKRSISRNGAGRQKVDELLALYASL